MCSSFKICKAVWASNNHVYFTQPFVMFVSVILQKNEAEWKFETNLTISQIKLPRAKNKFLSPNEVWKFQLNLKQVAFACFLALPKTILAPPTTIRVTANWRRLIQCFMLYSHLQFEINLWLRMGVLRNHDLVWSFTNTKIFSLQNICYGIYSISALVSVVIPK